MDASFQPLSGIIRAHPTGGFGDDWTWDCFVVVTEDTAHLYGAKSKPRPSEMRAVMRCLAAMGVRYMEWERRNVPLARKIRVAIPARYIEEA